MFTTKYRPNKLADFVGNEQQIQPFMKWLLTCDPKNKKVKKCALIYGQNGIGKSLLVDLMLKKHCYHAIYLSPDDERSKEQIQQTIKPLLHIKKTFDDKENVLVINDIDSSCGDHGLIAAIIECIKETEIPIICICDDKFNQNLKPILAHCFDIKMVKPKYAEIYSLVYKVVTQEKIKINKSSVDKLIEQANGDIRFILNSLQLGVNPCSKDIQSANIFDTTGRLFNMDATFQDKYATYWLAHDIHTLFVQENYVNCIMGSKDPDKCVENMTFTADSLSDADLLDANFDFDLAPYVAANTIHATLKCNKKCLIKFPRFLGKISTMNKNKREKLDYTQVKFTTK
jgi:replication factor C subunit 1